MTILEKSLASGIPLHKGALIAMLVAGSVVQSVAQIYTLSARNTSVQITDSGASSGLSDWLINGVNQLNQQWFYYSIGSGAVNSIDTISSPSAPVLGGSSKSPTFTTTYSDSLISVTPTFTLGSSPVGSSTATLGTTITINNPSASTQTYHFYQFSDFYLGGVSGNQSVQFTANGLGSFNVVQTSLTGASLVGTISAISGGASDTTEVEAGIGTTFGLVNGNPAPMFNDSPLSAGPGNVVFAYEWDATVVSGGSVTISEIQSVPEPFSVTLISSGLVALAVLSWRRQAAQLSFIHK